MSSVLKIGMVAPSKAGKTSLMTAIFHEMADKLAGNPHGIQYWAANPATKARIIKLDADRLAEGSRMGYSDIELK